MANCFDNIYVIQFTELAKGTITIPRNAFIADEADIILIGKDRLEYGEAFDANILHLLENFACPEDSANPNNPDFFQSYSTLLENAVIGQFWFNKTQEKIFVLTDSGWRPLASSSDVAGNHGIIHDGGFLPRPVAPNGYVFPYSECIYTVSPHTLPEIVDFFECYAANDGQVVMRYRISGSSEFTSDFANYQIVGIRGNINLGNGEPPAITPPPATPALSPTVTPSITPSPTSSVPIASPPPTPTNTRTPTPTPSVTPAPGASPTPTPTVTPTLTVTPTVTPAVTPTVTPSGAAPLTVSYRNNALGADQPFGGLLTSVCSTVDDSDGFLNCSSSASGECSTGCGPAPGLPGGSSSTLGPELAIRASGGVPPYTIRMQNVTNTGGIPAGECIKTTAGVTISPFPSGVVVTLNSSASGQLVGNIVINGVCGFALYSTDGTFDIETEDSIGSIVTDTFNYFIERNNSSTGGGTEPE